MFDVQWARLHPDSGSWHAIQDESHRGVDPNAKPRPTYCGREAFGDLVDDLPAHVKGCESCDTILLRLLEKMAVIS